MAKRHIVPKDYRETLDSILEVLRDECSPAQAFTIQAQSVTVSALVSEFQEYVTPFDAVKRIEIQLEQAYRARDASIAVGSARAAMVKAALTAYLGREHPALDRTGLRSVGGARKLTVEQEVVRHAKAQETMKLQGRLTKAQKKEKTYRGPVDVRVVLKKDK